MLWLWIRSFAGGQWRQTVHKRIFVSWYLISYIQKEPINLSKGHSKNISILFIVIAPFHIIFILYIIYTLIDQYFPCIKRKLNINDYVFSPFKIPKINDLFSLQNISNSSFHHYWHTLNLIIDLGKRKWINFDVSYLYFRIEHKEKLS